MLTPEQYVHAFVGVVTHIVWIVFTDIYGDCDVFQTITVVVAGRTDNRARVEDGLLQQRCRQLQFNAFAAVNKINLCDTSIDSGGRMNSLHTKLVHHLEQVKRAPKRIRHRGDHFIESIAVNIA